MEPAEIPPTHSPLPEIFRGGLNLDAATGILSGTPDTTGTFLFTIFATDDNDCIGSADYVVIINDAACPAITLTPSTLSNGTAGILYEQDLTATGATDPVTFSLLTGSTPDGITLDPDGTISGLSAAPETATFEVLATDDNGCLALRSTHSQSMLPFAEELH